MIGLSVMLQGDRAVLAALARHLHIPDRNVFLYGQVIEDFSFYDRQENSMQCATLGGDFDFMCDVSVFDMSEEVLTERLRQFSSGGARVATPDEESERPDDCILYELGKILKVEVRKDDVLEQVAIIRPKQGVT